MWPAAVGGLHGLTINNSCTWSRFPSRLKATAFSQRRHDLFPHSFIPKLRNIAVHRGARRILSRNHAPGAPSSQHIKDPIEYCSHIHCAWSPTCLLRGDQWFKNLPFSIREIRRIGFHGRSHLPWIDALYSPFSL